MGRAASLPAVMPVFVNLQATRASFTFPVQSCGESTWDRRDPRRDRLETVSLHEVGEGEGRQYPSVKWARARRQAGGYVGAREAADALSRQRSETAPRHVKRQVGRAEVDGDRLEVQAGRAGHIVEVPVS